MDPMGAAVILAVIGGVGTGVGERLWDGLGELVHRGGGDTSAPEGSRELGLLRANPEDRQSAATLAGILESRAAGDANFRRALDLWHREAVEHFPVASMQVGSVHNEVSGGTFHQPVVMTGNATLNFGPTSGGADPVA